MSNLKRPPAEFWKNMAEENKKQNEITHKILKQQYIDSGRTEEEAEALIEANLNKVVREYEYQPLYVGDIFRIPTSGNYKDSIVEIKSRNTKALLCQLENNPAKAVLYISALYREEFDINKAMQRAEIIGWENLSKEIENTSGSVVDKIKKLCEIAGGRKFELFEKRQVIPYDRNKKMITIDKFRLLE